MTVSCILRPTDVCRRGSPAVRVSDAEQVRVGVVGDQRQHRRLASTPSGGQGRASGNCRLTQIFVPGPARSGLRGGLGGCNRSSGRPGRSSLTATVRSPFVTHRTTVGSNATASRAEPLSLPALWLGQRLAAMLALHSGSPLDACCTTCGSNGPAKRRSVARLVAGCIGPHQRPTSRGCSDGDCGKLHPKLVELPLHDRLLDHNEVAPR